MKNSERKNISHCFRSAYFGLLGKLFYFEHFAEEKTPKFRIVNNYYLHKKYPLSAIAPYTCYSRYCKYDCNNDDKAVLRKYT